MKHQSSPQESPSRAKLWWWMVLQLPLVVILRTGAGALPKCAGFKIAEGWQLPTCETIAPVNPCLRNGISHQSHASRIIAATGSCSIRRHWELLFTARAGKMMEMGQLGLLEGWHRYGGADAHPALGDSAGSPQRWLSSWIFLVACASFRLWPFFFFCLRLWPQPVLHGRWQFSRLKLSFF